MRPYRLLFQLLLRGAGQMVGTVFRYALTGRARLFVLMLIAAVAAADGSGLPPLKPYRGLAYTQQDIDKVRQQVAQKGANAKLVKEIVAIADEWMGRSEAEIVALIPDKDAIFAFGSTNGDPRVAGKTWAAYGDRMEMCSLDRPGEIRSPHTGDVYGIQKEGEAFYDPGTGWVRPSDGKVFYFKGMWNSYVIGQLDRGIDNLALAYMLTGNEAYANRALFMLDRLATLRVQLPTQGTALADWPHPTRADSKKGFFRYMGNHANRRMVNMAFVFDLIGGVALADTPSAGGSGLSIRENILQNYFDIFEMEYMDSRQLTNHATILVSNMVAQGVLKGDAQLLATGLDALYAMFDNTINRDGDYMEVSGLYGQLGRGYGGRIIAALANYDPSNYTNADEMPNPEDYPFNLKFGDDPRWYKTAVHMLYRQAVLGRYPHYGDMSNSETQILLGQDDPKLTQDRIHYLRMLYGQTSREDWKREIEALYALSKGREHVGFGADDLLMYGLAMWVEPEAPTADAVAISPALLGETSDLMGGKVIALLRSGKAADKRALFMRGGINAYHGHDDQMALVPYGQGLMLAGEFGYGFAGTPDHLGWGTRSVSHMTAVVDEDLPAQYLYKGYSHGFSAANPAPAASVSGFLRGKDLPAQLIEMNNPGLYHRSNLREYRRTAWLVDIDPQHYYFVDMFRIAGGRTHDYVWNAPYTGFNINRPGVTAQQRFRVEGIEPTAKAGVWTLASLSGANRDEPWNQKGKSWGERLNGLQGRVMAQKGEKPFKTTRWNPEPGNGYGMIWNVKTDETRNNWRSFWRLPDDKHYSRTHHVNMDGLVAITAKAPSKAQDRPFDVVISRRTLKDHGEGNVLRSRFVTVMEIGNANNWSLVSAEALPLQLGGDRGAMGEQAAIGLKVNLPEGLSDFFLSSSAEGQTLDGGAVRLAGRNGFARVDAGGQLVALEMQEATSLEAAGVTLQTAAPKFRGKILKVQELKDDGFRVVVSGDLPGGNFLTGSSAWVQGDLKAKIPYAHNDFYTVETVEPTGSAGTSALVFKEQSFIYTRFVVDKIKPEASQIELYWLNELAGRAGTFAYQGRAVVDENNKNVEPLTQVEWIRRRDVKLADVGKLEEGQKLKVMVAQPGDYFDIPFSGALRKLPEQAMWQLSANAPVTLSVPAAFGSRLFVRSENSAEVEIPLERAKGGLLRAQIDLAQLGSPSLTLRFAP